MRPFEEHGRSIVTLVMEASANHYEENGDVIAYVREIPEDELRQVVLYLAGWVTGFFEDLGEYSSHLARVDEKLGEV